MYLIPNVNILNLYMIYVYVQLLKCLYMYIYDHIWDRCLGWFFSWLWRHAKPLGKILAHLLLPPSLSNSVSGPLRQRSNRLKSSILLALSNISCKEHEEKKNKIVNKMFWNCWCQQDKIEIEPWIQPMSNGSQAKHADVAWCTVAANRLSFTAGISFTFAIILTYCDPCPGKSNATLDKNEFPIIADVWHISTLPKTTPTGN